MSKAATGFRAFQVYLEMIKIEHSIFALPFALLGVMWASLSRFGVVWPGGWIFGWVLVAMVSSRSAAMAFNRIADRDIDALNPRTSMRALPAGLLSFRSASLFFWGSIAVFVTAAAMLNPLALSLAPVALLVILGYSWSKRFTWLCHFILGLSLGIAPAAGWIAVTGQLHPVVLPITLAVTLWTAGFDLIYALQDDDFDRKQGLHSLPARFGRRGALATSRVCHILSVGSLVWGGLVYGAGPWYFAGCVLAAALLAYEQSLVKPQDLSRVNLAFFTLNGWVSIGFFAFAAVDAAL